ncbi:hypothetical protein [Lactiplantibacillus plantarum]|uniref:hypothetical protein n=1 Tax=Lactiplantibacillus plantarum TaxID=1590 RepID=UPI004045269A
MEFLIVIATIVALIVGYFCLGMLLKLLLQWWLPLVCAGPLLILAFGFGWTRASTMASSLWRANSCRSGGWPPRGRGSEEEEASIWVMAFRRRAAAGRC